MSVIKMATHRETLCFALHQMEGWNYSYLKRLSNKKLEEMCSKLNYGIKWDR